jgi:hypothetical protein
VHDGDVSAVSEVTGCYTGICSRSFLSAAGVSSAAGASAAGAGSLPQPASVATIDVASIFSPISPKFVIKRIKSR